MIGPLGLPDIPPGGQPRCTADVPTSDASATTRFLRDLARAFGLLIGGAPAGDDTPFAAGTAAPTPGPRPPGELRDLILAAARQEGVPPALLAAVVEVESGFNPHAVSPAGAKGLTQLMDGTARALGVTDPFDPWQSLIGGARYLRTQLARFSGNVALALAAYNAGPGAVEAAGGQVPPYAETRLYVRRALAAYARNTRLGGVL